jgi:hypothetical protein
MSQIQFQAGGPLLGDSEVYVLRDADSQAAAHLQRMEYITFIEPRQHGKTSLINHLITKFTPRGFSFAVRDLMAAKASSASVDSWYKSLGAWLLRQIDFITPQNRPKEPVDSASWESFLAEIAEAAKSENRNLVIVLDEIGAMPISWATDFFSVIRSIYTSRQNLPFWQHLTFIISGAFNPKELIQDNSISNFNVDQRISLDDFTLNEVEKLVNYLDCDRKIAEILSSRIYYWTCGQPYLTQRLCKTLLENKNSIEVGDSTKFVDKAVDLLFKEDIHHLARVKDLASDIDLLSYTRQLTRPPRSRFSASLNDKQFKLAHIIGIIKSDQFGKCEIRNRVYERALRELETSNAYPSKLKSEKGEGAMTELSPEMQSKAMLFLFEIGRWAATELKERWSLARKRKNNEKKSIEVDLSNTDNDGQEQVILLLNKIVTEKGVSQAEQVLKLIERKRNLISEWEENKVDNEEEFGRQTITRAALRLRQEELNQKIMSTMLKIVDDLETLDLQVAKKRID